MQQSGEPLAERERLEQMREHMVSGMRRMAVRMAAIQDRLAALERGDAGAPPVPGGAMGCQHGQDGEMNAGGQGMGRGTGQAHQCQGMQQGQGQGMQQQGMGQGMQQGQGMRMRDGTGPGCQATPAAPAPAPPPADGERGDDR